MPFLKWDKSVKCVRETKKGILLSVYEKEDDEWIEYWFPKSQLNLDEEGIQMPQWLWDRRDPATPMGLT